jgi:hypothetical protein
MIENLDIKTEQAIDQELADAVDMLNNDKSNSELANMIKDLTTA